MIATKTLKNWQNLLIDFHRSEKDGEMTIRLKQTTINDPEAEPAEEEGETEKKLMPTKPRTTINEEPKCFS